MKNIGLITTACVFAIFGILWQSYLFQTSLNWFLLDMALPLVTQKSCAAGILFTRYITYQFSETDKDKDIDAAERVGRQFGIAFLSPVFMYIGAYMIHRFM